MKYYKMKLVKDKINKNPSKPLSKKKLAKYITIAILILTLVGVTIYENFSFSEEEADINNNTDSLPLRIPNIRNYFITCRLDSYSCSITCENIIFPDDYDEIYSKLEEAKNTGCDKSELTFSAADFENKRIDKNWLKLSNETHPKIIKIEISTSNLKFISPESFSNLEDLETICLGNLKELTHLHKESFSGLLQLKNLAIWEMSELKSIEFGFLSNFPNLETIAIQRVMIDDFSCEDSNLQLFSNLTGNSTAKKIQTVDFRQNCLENITRGMLNGYPNAVQIFLNVAEIRRFENESLKNLTRLQQFDVSDNHFKKMEEKVFRKFLENNKALSLTMNENKLQCDCELKWLQDYIKENGGNLVGTFRNIKCDNFENVSVLEADMCPNGTTTWPSTTPETTTEATTPENSLNSTTEPPSNFSSTASTNVPDAPPTDEPPEGDYGDSQPIEIKCKPQSKVGQSRTIRSALLPYIRVQLPIKKLDENDLVFTLAPKQQYFNISDYDGTTVNVTFNNLDHAGRSILWLTYEESNNFLLTKKQTNPIASSCSTNILKKWYLIQNLEPQKSYLICVFDDIEFNVNLLDCVPHTTQPLVENQAWLTFGSKPMAIIIVVVVSIGAFAVGSVLLFVLVRKNPTLIKGSKKVIVVKRQDKQQVMIMPNNYKNFKNEEDKSDSYSVVSYISAIQPSPMEILAYRLERLREKCQEDSDGKRGNLAVPPKSNLESGFLSSPRASIRTIISADTIYENDFELSSE